MPEKFSAREQARHIQQIQRIHGQRWPHCSLLYPNVIRYLKMTTGGVKDLLSGRMSPKRARFSLVPQGYRLAITIANYQIGILVFHFFSHEIKLWSTIGMDLLLRVTGNLHHGGHSSLSQGTMVRDLHQRGPSWVSQGLRSCCEISTSRLVMRSQASRSCSEDHEYCTPHPIAMSVSRVWLVRT